MSGATAAGTAGVQGELWSARSADWAEIQEGQVRPAYVAALDALGVDAGTRMLDVGCGAGMALRLAADRGAEVAGLDASEGMVTIARDRIPDARIEQGELEKLPFDDDAFDVVTGFNAFQFAARPVAALGEAVRVLVSTGRVLMLTWGPPEACESVAYLEAMRPFMPPPPPGAPGPFALSDAGALEAVLDEAQLDVVAIEDVPCVWEYPDEQTALRGLLSAGPVVVAMRNASEQAVTAAVRDFLPPFEVPGVGYRISNVFRYVIGEPRAPAG